MSECEQCENFRYYIRDLKNELDSLREDLAREELKTDNYESVKKERDELKAAANRSYDNDVTTPRGMPQ